MNLAETLALLDKLNAVGAKHFKSGDMEVSLQDIVIGPAPQKSRETDKPQPAPEPAYSPENTNKVQELIDLLKMKDEQLVNTIFPAGA